MTIHMPGEGGVKQVTRVPEKGGEEKDEGSGPILSSTLVRRGKTHAGKQGEQAKTVSTHDGEALANEANTEIMSTLYERGQADDLGEDGE